MEGRQRRSFTDDYKRQAVDLVASSGRSIGSVAKERGGICLDNFDWWSLTPDWSVIDEQVRRLAPPRIDGPSLIPDLWQRW
jgi:hypothetical protein